MDLLLATDETGASEEHLEAMACGLAQAHACSPAGADGEGSSDDWVIDGGRRYTRLLGTDLYDAWLIEWGQGSELDLHDHGGSTAAICVVRGTLIEYFVDLPAGPPPAQIGPEHPLRTTVLQPGAVHTVPSNRVHSVGNPGPARAASVHVYSPPLGEMQFFDPDRDGAWTLRIEADLPAASHPAAT